MWSEKLAMLEKESLVRKFGNIREGKFGQRSWQYERRKVWSEKLPI